jgi:hypothetical protein
MIEDFWEILRIFRKIKYCRLPILRLPSRLHASYRPRDTAYRPRDCGFALIANCLF